MIPPRLARRTPLFERAREVRRPPAAGAYGRLVGTLEQHISPLTARSIVDRALAALGLEAARLVASDLPRVIESARMGLQMFCDPGHFSALTQDLSELCEDGAVPRRVGAVGDQPQATGVVPGSHTRRGAGLSAEAAGWLSHKRGGSRSR